MRSRLFKRPEDDLDPVLRQAVDEYFQKLKNDVVSRLLMGERTYRGRWKTLSWLELQRELKEEEDDVHAYKIFLAAKTKQNRSQYR